MGGDDPREANDATMSETYEEQEQQQPVEVPYGELSPETLRAVLESFVLREGTDYGNREFSLDDKVAHVMRQLEDGRALLLYDPNTESVTLQPADRPQRRGADMD